MRPETTVEVPAERISYANRYVESLEKEIAPYIGQVEHGPFVSSVTDGTFPLDGIRFVHTNHYHLIINDMGNLNLYVAKARDEEEMLFFHFMAAEEKNHLMTLFLLTDGLGIKRDRGLGRLRLRVRDRCRAQSLAVKPESLIRL